MRRNGFTLVEVVVALFIFGLLSAAGVALMSFALRAQSSSAEALQEVAADRRLSAILLADFAQAVPRLSRDSGGTLRPAFQAKEGSLLFAYVKGGARVQHVEIRLENGRLVRRAAAHADGAATSSAMVLADNVAAAAVRFRNTADWEDRWAPTRSDAMPRAVELTITQAGRAPLRRLFLVGTGS